MKKLCMIYDTAPRYREAIYRKIDQNYDCDWYIGTIQNGIKEMDLSLLKNVSRFNIKGNYNKLYWQCGILQLLLSKKYETFFIGAETRALSKWVFFLFASLFCRRKKIYVWTHGWYGKETGLQKIIKKWIYNHVTAVFLYANYTKNLMVNEGIDKGKLFVIHNSLHYELQKALRDKICPSDIYLKHFNNNNKVICFIGRLTSGKRLDILLHAISELKDLNELYNITFIGDGDERNNLEHLATELGITKQLWFYGACYNESVNAELVYNADLCVAPGNVGLTAIHAMVFGCPVISHNDFAWQMPEFESIIPGITGDFFERGNIHNLAKAISIWFTSNSKKREEVRKACYAEIDNYWNPQFQLKVIKKVINNKADIDTTIKIGIAYHKACNFIQSDIFIPIQVGAANSTVDLGIQKDNDNDNISFHNAYCSEMSATYWIWKNINAEYKGLFHYRRFLTFEKQCPLKKWKSASIYIATKVLAPFIKDSRVKYFAYPTVIISEKDTKKHLDRFVEDLRKDIRNNSIDCYSSGFIYHSTYSIKTHLQRAIGYWHSVYIKQLIESEYPTFNKYFKQTLKDNKFVGFNMIVAKADIFDDYCTIMFDILSRYHNHMNHGIPSDVVNVAMLRDSGYIAELISDAYLRKIADEGKTVKHIGCLNIDMDLGGMSSKTTPLLKKILGKI